MDTARRCIEEAKTTTAGAKLTVRGSSQKAADLSRVISRAVTGALVRNEERQSTFHVKDLASSATEAEVAKGVAAAAGITAEEVQVTSLRTAYGATQKAIVKVGRSHLGQLREVGRVKVGFLSCKISERKADRKCHKCWSTRHTAAQCDGSGQKGKCFNCNEPGHIRANCNKDDKGHEGQRRPNAARPHRQCP